MIHGVGTDICAVDRIRQALERHGDAFAHRILTPSEREMWQERRDRHDERGWRFVATRFAAKEALAKALGLGMVWPMGWQVCEVVWSVTGQPTWRWHGPLQAWCLERGLQAHLSLSDEAQYVVAFVVVESQAQGPAGAEQKWL